MRARMATTIKISTLHCRNIFLIAENDQERLSLENIATKDPLAQVLHVFNKRVALQIDILIAGIVNFHPGRIIAVFVQPVRIQRSNFRDTQCRLSHPNKRRILRNINRIDNANSIRTNNFIRRIKMRVHRNDRCVIAATWFRLNDRIVTSTRR